MELRCRIRYALTRPWNKALFRRNAYRVLLEPARRNNVASEELQRFIDELYRWRYTEVRCDPMEFFEPFGRSKLRMVFHMALYAGSLYERPLAEVPWYGRWELKYTVRDRFAPDDPPAVVLRKWAGEDVLFWNIMAGLKWESQIFQPDILSGSDILDYGCNVGALSYLARFYGAHHVTLVDVPGAPLEFAGSFLGTRTRVLPVTDQGPPSGLADCHVDVAYCYDVLEHVAHPLAVVRAIRNALRPEGYFYCTFIALPNTRGGCNLRGAQAARADVIAFLRERFEVLSWKDRRGVYVLRRPA